MTNKTNTTTNTINTKDITHTFYSTRGIVIGTLWGGGLGAYPARDYSAATVDELKAKLQKAFDLGSLDSGAGFERLLAAGVVIVDEASITINDQVFTSKSESNYVLGDEDLFQEKIDAGWIQED